MDFGFAVGVDVCPCVCIYVVQGVCLGETLCLCVCVCALAHLFSLRGRDQTMSDADGDRPYHHIENTEGEMVDYVAQSFRLPRPCVYFLLC